MKRIKPYCKFSLFFNKNSCEQKSIFKICYVPQIEQYDMYLLKYLKCYYY